MRTIKFKAWDKNYEVGSDGSVWSVNFNNTGKRKQLRTYPDQDGYPYVFLQFGKRKKKMVHRMVAESFIKKPSPKHQVNHKNGIRNDNRLENLEWCTSRENALHGYRVNGRKLNKWQSSGFGESIKGESNPKAKITKEIADKIREARKSGLYLKDVAKRFKISVAQVSVICSGRFWK